ncbi:2131_t:CDS:2 [Entrophospora sp. SA101]|nr:2131_t:CDS:2 [Entrophospora sp. SA101]
MQENIFEENQQDSDNELDYYIANITRRPQNIYQDESLEYNEFIESLDNLEDGNGDR